MIFIEFLLKNAGFFFKKNPKNCLVLKFLSLKEKKISYLVLLENKLQNQVKNAKKVVIFIGKILTEINRLKEILTG